MSTVWEKRRPSLFLGFQFEKKTWKRCKLLYMVATLPFFISRFFKVLTLFLHFSSFFCVLPVWRKGGVVSVDIQGHLWPRLIFMHEDNCDICDIPGHLWARLIFMLVNIYICDICDIQGHLCARLIFRRYLCFWCWYWYCGDVADTSTVVMFLIPVLWWCWSDILLTYRYCGNHDLIHYCNVI